MNGVNQLCFEFVSCMCVLLYIIPHFSDGIGRTGAFIGIYAQLERIKTEGIADVFQYIKGARLQCPGFVSSVVSMHNISNRLHAVLSLC